MRTCFIRTGPDHLPQNIARLVPLHFKNFLLTSVHNQQTTMFWACCGARVTPRGLEGPFKEPEALLSSCLLTYPNSDAAFQSMNGFADFDSIIGILAYLNGLAWVLRGEPPPEVITIMGGLTASESWRLDHGVSKQLRGQCRTGSFVYNFI